MTLPSIIARKGEIQMRTLKLMVMWIAIVFAEAAYVGAQQTGKPLSNQDVISMAKNLLPETVIISAIKTNDTDFDVSANGLIALKRAGVSPKVMEAVLAAASGKKNGGTISSTQAPAAPMLTAAGPAQGAVGATFAGAPTAGGAPVAGVSAAATAPPWQPVVSTLQAGATANLPAEATQIVLTKTKPASLSALAKDQALNAALQTGTQAAQQAVMKTGSAMALSALNPGTALLTGFMKSRASQAKVTYVWALAGGSSPAAGNSQMFEANYAGLPGVNADQFEPVIVKITPTPQANFKLVGATEAATTAEQSAQQDWPIYSSFVEDRAAATVQKLGYGRAQVTPTVALAPGEYAVVLRPIDKSKKFAGEDVARNQGEGLLFNYAWPFSVK
jgi:hypothetical protein